MINRSLFPLLFISGIATTRAEVAYEYSSAASEEATEGGAPSVDNNGKEVLCPFVKLGMPRTTNIKAFCDDLQDKGMQWTMCFGVAATIVQRQKGFGALLAGEAPDIYRLDEVPGISHLDLYTKDFGLTTMMVGDATDEDGMISLDDLVRIKKQIAEREEVSEINGASRIETTLAFVKSGGDQKTGLVNATNVLTFLQGKEPDVFVEINFSNLAASNKWAKWD